MVLRFPELKLNKAVLQLQGGFIIDALGTNKLLSR